MYKITLSDIFKSGEIIFSRGAMMHKVYVYATAQNSRKSSVLP